MYKLSIDDQNNGGNIPEILIVDDSRMQSKIYETYLQNTFECDLAPDGIDAVMMYKNANKEPHPYIIIIMDIGMPIMNGAEAIDKIRKVDGLNDYLPTSYIIVSTAMADYELKTEVNLDLEMVDKVIRKPVTKEVLIETIKEAIAAKVGKRF